MYFLYTATSSNSVEMLSYYVPLNTALTQLFAPTFYFYMLKLLNKPIKHVWAHFIVVVPSIIYVIYFMMQPVDIRISMVHQDLQRVSIYRDILNLIFFVQLIVYLFVFLRMFNNQMKISPYVEQNGAKFKITWIKSYVNTGLAFGLLGFPLCFIFKNDYFITIYAIVTISALLYVVFISFMWRPTSFIVKAEEEVNKSIQSESSLKISDDKAEQYFKVIETLMKTEKVYLQEGFSLLELSKKTEIPVHHLSHIINKYLNKSFNEYLNVFRVDAAKAMLKDSKMKHISIEGIGYECGFGSKSSFNKVFKKLVEQTPSEYRNS